MSENPIATWAASPGAQKLLAEARRRIERGSKLVRGTVRLELTPKERHDIGSLLGLEWEVSGRDVRAAAVHQALEARGTTLRDLLEASAPLRDRRAERVATQLAADAERTRASDTLTAAGVAPAAAAWVLSRRGLPRAGTGALVVLAEQASLTWSSLPGAEAPPQLLAEFAGKLFNSTHALDRSTALGRTVVRLAASRDLDPETLAAVDVTSADAWRAAWAAVGVVCDEVSSLVLVLNLPLDGDTAAAHVTAVRGEPIWLSLRSFRGIWKPGIRSLWVCENPSIVEAAADRLGERCAPLMCTFGQPSVAALRLLRGCADAEVSIKIRADDDPAGQSIVAKLRTVAPLAEHWRYEVRSSEEAGESPVYEEQLLPILIKDLAGT